MSFIPVPLHHFHVETPLGIWRAKRRPVLLICASLSEYAIAEKCYRCGSAGPCDEWPQVSEQPRVSLSLAVYVTDIFLKKKLLKVCHYCLKRAAQLVSATTGRTNGNGDELELPFYRAHFEKEKTSKEGRLVMDYCYLR